MASASGNEDSETDVLMPDNEETVSKTTSDSDTDTSNANSDKLEEDAQETVVVTAEKVDDEKRNDHDLLTSKTETTTDKDKQISTNQAESMDDARDDSLKDKPKPAVQAQKRRPDKELNHDNWDQEDEPEEKGEFVKASIEQLKDRKFLTAKRKQKPSSNPVGNPFGTLNLANAFGVPSAGTGNNTRSMFNFGNDQPAASPTPKFDFSSVSSSSKPVDKQSSSDKNDAPVSTKKLKTGCESASPVKAPADVNSATTV